VSVSPPADPDLFFFLSFAETNDVENGLVREFFHALRDEVRAQAGIGMSRRSRTGFLSIASLELGDDWSQDIREALGTCAVFVALTAPAYFASPSCGKEWQAFADRRAADPAGRTMPVLLPVRWRPSDMPAVAGGIQYVDPKLSAAVHAQGLLAVARATRSRDDYDAFVAALAELIVRRARKHRLAPLLPGPDFDRLPQAFPPAPPPPPPPAPPPAGPPPDDGPPDPPTPPKPRYGSDFPYFST
jgi:hypothetical protein